MKEATQNENIKICTVCGREHTNESKYFCKHCYYKRSVTKLKELAPKILCNCNCGELISSIRADSKPMKFKRGHNSFGNKNTWKGGEYVDSQGYKRVHDPNHPNSDNSGYVRKHVKVMSEHLSRPLKKGEIVHHINGNKMDNGLENLQLLENQAKHIQLHMTKDMTNRFCKICNSKNTYKSPGGYSNWQVVENGFLCKKCSRKKGSRMVKPSLGSHQ